MPTRNPERPPASDSAALGGLRRWLRGGWPFPVSVRSRLLLTFAVLFLSAMALALVGWWGIRDTRDALRRFFEVDTGEQKGWTIQLTDTPGAAPPRP